MKIMTEIRNLTFLGLKSSFTLDNRPNKPCLKIKISKRMGGLMCIVLASFANFITLIGVDIIKNICS